MSNNVLTLTELRELTQKKRYGAMCRELDTMNIEYRKRLDGSPVVLRESIWQEFKVKSSNNKNHEPKMGSFNA